MVIKSSDYIKNNPIGEKNTAIIVTSHQGHLSFLKYALTNYMKSGAYVICSYDRHGENIPSDIMDIPHAWTFKHQTFGAEKRNGWLWDIIYGAGIIEIFDNIKYIFTVNSDCIWDKPKSIHGMINLLGDDEILSASTSRDGLIHTCNVLWRRSTFLQFVYILTLKLKENIPESYSPEVLLKEFASDYMCKVKVAPKQPIYPKHHFYQGKVDHYSSYNQDSTWKDILGYRNLGAEHKAACLEHLEPVDKKYFDLRNTGEFLNKHERDTLFHYYLFDDRRYLYKYWTEGEDSYWNRRYYPIEYYGLEPLEDDSKRKELGPPSERLGHFDRWKYNSFVLKDEEYYSKWKSVIEGS